MNLQLSNQAHWQNMMRRQGKLNAERWIALLKNKETTKNIAVEDYDNILRALEYTLRASDTFPLSIQIIDLLFSDIFIFADWDRWFIYLEKALEQSQATGNALAEAKICEKLGDMYYVTNQNSQAELHFLQSKKIYKFLRDLTQYANILTKLGILYIAQGKSDLGLQTCLKALSIAQTENDKLGIAKIELNLSSIYLENKNWDEALKSASNSYQLYKEANNSDFAARALTNMFIAWFHLGMLEEMGNKPEELIQELSEMGNVYILGKLKLNLGTFAAENGNLNEAENYYQEALHLSIQNQIPQDIAAIYNNLGFTYLQMEEWASAEEMLLKAIDLFKELGDHYEWTNAMDNLALLHEAMGDTAVACKILSEAISISSKKERQPHTDILLKEMQTRLDNYGKSASSS